MFLKKYLLSGVLPVLTIGAPHYNPPKRPQHKNAKTPFLELRVFSNKGQKLTGKKFNLRIGEDCFGTSTEFFVWTNQDGIIKIEKREDCFSKEYLNWSEGKNPNEIKAFLDWKEGSNVFRGGATLFIRGDGRFGPADIKVVPIPILFRGKILDSKTKQPIAGAKVVLFSWPSLSPRHFMRTTSMDLNDLYYPESLSSKDGFFTVYGLRPKGLYLFFVSKEGYLVNFIGGNGKRSSTIYLDFPSENIRLGKTSDAEKAVKLLSSHDKNVSKEFVWHQTISGPCKERYFLWAHVFSCLSNSRAHFVVWAGCGGRSLSVGPPFLRMEAWYILFCTKYGLEYFPIGDIAVPADLQRIYGKFAEKIVEGKWKVNIGLDVSIKFQIPEKKKISKKISLGPWIWGKK